VVEGRKGAEAEEGCGSLRVGDAGGEAEGGVVEVSSCGEKEGVAVRGGAEGLTKVTNPQLLLGGGAVQEGKGVIEVVVLCRREDSGGVILGGEGEDLGFGAVGWAEQGEMMDRKG
jgi:hypothetical protein